MIRIFYNRPSEIRFRENLPNGQEVHLYLYRHRSMADYDIPYQWFAAFYIGSRKEANRWFNHKKKKGRKDLIKGDGSLTALRWALFHIKIFISEMDRREELVIGWEDDRRARAYRYLKRYGFTEYYNQDTQKYDHLGVRNPEHWVTQKI